GRADRAAESVVEALPEIAPVVAAEHEAEAERSRQEAEAEGAEVDEAAAAEQQRAQRDEHDRHDVRRHADEVAKAAGEPGARRAAVPASVEDGAEEDPDADEREAGELRPVVARELAPADGLRLRLLADPRRLPRAQRRRPLLARHEPDFDAPGATPSRMPLR